MSDTATPSKAPQADRAEDNAYFPSPYSLSQYTAPHTDFDGGSYNQRYRGDGRILVVASDERYLKMGNGKLFSTGNHPIETLLPLMHLHHAGFAIELATLSGNPVKLEHWAMPHADAAVMAFYRQLLPQLHAPRKLADILPRSGHASSPYLAVFIPGGHAALNGLPYSRDLKQLLQWAIASDRHVISLCHGPAGLLAAALDDSANRFLFRDYSLCVFPDAIDAGANLDIGYLPGPMPWLLAARLQDLGMTVLNEGISGQCHRDGLLLTGDSPLASNALGRLAADTLLARYGH